MLVLCRYAGESIIIGDNVKMTVERIEGKKVRLSFDAPKEVQIYREELYDAIKQDKLGKD